MIIKKIIIYTPKLQSLLCVTLFLASTAFHRQRTHMIMFQLAWNAALHLSEDVCAQNDERKTDTTG